MQFNTTHSAFDSLDMLTCKLRLTGIFRQFRPDALPDAIDKPLTIQTCYNHLNLHATENMVVMRNVHSLVCSNDAIYMYI